MMRGAIHRVHKYDLKLTKAGILRDLTAKVDDMKLRFNSATISLALMETSVKQQCDGAGVPIIHYPFYLDFGREMWHEINGIELSGESAAQEAAILIAKWVARGLTSSVLQAIRTQVFNVEAPA